ncbi:MULTISPECIES: DUF3179 domain-containing (seleno)protein [Aliiruegeria]|uniref:DUF3179 domain-containing protein n=1 Tax=Aliiruegeria lutimaris TaxID=571298 RepID=A0A1G9FAM8_9RHOB|nr:MULTISPECIES: DUF3179 domain-containing (seleno)protein [Aliiruegeria]NDR55676.1 DUF3179 domain-containing protein [Pseudoruegeria sp. M32A2M]SDK85426.1 Protein of unknown function [Aliiruegeria lutimaris]
MLANILFYAGFAVSLGIALLYFRDLGDIPQMIMKTKRANIDRFIRNEYTFLSVGFGGWLVMAVTHFGFGAGPGWLFWISTVLTALLVAFTWIYVHIGLRNQKESARFYSIEEAKEFVSPTTQVIVLEKNGVARAHPQSQIMRPHLAGTEEGLEGSNVVMTFCAIANLGLGMTPEVEGEKIELEVLAQHGNNLVLRDNATGEPIQQIYGFRAKDADTTADGPACPLRQSLAMQPWPTFRMTFRGFQKAYPEGTVFLNKPPKNPLLWLLDFAMEMAFVGSIQKHHTEAKPIMQNLENPIDPRLPTKSYVWGVNIGSDATCWTDDFVVSQGNTVNAVVGGQPLVVSWSPLFESMNVWVNDTGADVAEVDIYGKTPDGHQLARSADVKAGLFWHVWAEFFPHTDINRVGDVAAVSTEEAAA